MEKGILIDTGASVNIHGSSWLTRFTEAVVKHMNFWTSKFSVAGHKVTGVEGGNVGTNHGLQVPGNICG